MSTALMNSPVKILPELYNPSYIASTLTERDAPIGIGTDFLAVLRKSSHMRRYASRIQQNALELKFTELRNVWKNDMLFSSSLSDAVNHSAYREIITMGKKVVPLILKELQKQPDHWFWALSCITGEDPVKPEDRGRVKKMAEAWLQWGRESGYV